MQSSIKESWLCHVIAVMLAIVVTPVFADNEPAPTNAEMLRELKALRTRVGELEKRDAARESADKTLQRSEAYLRIVDDVIRDASARQSFEGNLGFFYANPKSGAQTGGENFLITSKGLYQASYIYRVRGKENGDNHRESHFNQDYIQMEWSFATGGVAGGLRVMADPDDNEVLIDQALITFNCPFLPDTRISVGEAAIPFSRTLALDDSDQLARTAPHNAYTFNPGRAQGIWFTHVCSDDLRFVGSINDGINSAEPDSEFKEEADDEVRYAVSGRLEYVLSRTEGVGSLDSWYRDWAPMERNRMSWMDLESGYCIMGLGGHYQRYDRGESLNNLKLFTFDVEHKRGPLLCILSGYMLDATENSNMRGITGQVAYSYAYGDVIVQPFIIAEGTNLNSFNTSGSDNINFLTLGTNVIINENLRFKGGVTTVYGSLPDLSSSGLAIPTAIGFSHHLLGNSSGGTSGNTTLVFLVAQARY